MIYSLAHRRWFLADTVSKHRSLAWQAVFTMNENGEANHYSGESQMGLNFKKLYPMTRAGPYSRVSLFIDSAFCKFCLERFKKIVREIHLSHKHTNTHTQSQPRKATKKTNRGLLCGNKCQWLLITALRTNYFLQQNASNQLTAINEFISIIWRAKRCAL